MHSAFYYFGGLWELDLDNPPLIITLIGFLLMFAGLFAIISGAVHGISMNRLRLRDGWHPGNILKKKLVTAAFILIVAWTYFLLTGPGLSDFSTQNMNNSILVEWIRYGRWTGISLERLFYVDSLVMIGSNILFVSLIWILLQKIGKLRPKTLLALAGIVMAISLFRLPLYPIYLAQFEQENWLQVIALFWLVNKNNPVLPFLAFGLLGAWLGLRLEEGRSRRPALWLGLSLLILGVALYILLPDTMLQRMIDLKWYSIMVIQLGLFLLMVLAALAVFDRDRPPPWTNSPVIRFIQRFGYAGLTAFFWESILAAIVWRILTAVFPDLVLNIGGALLYGTGLALVWGFILLLWEKFHYVGSIEFFYGLIVGKFGKTSSKAAKLRE